MQYSGETGDYDVTIERDERSAVNPTGRKLYRFQVQGPTALEVLEKVTGGELPEIKFFNMGEVTIAGHKVRALHHGMSGVPGARAVRADPRRATMCAPRSSRPARSSGSPRWVRGSTRRTRSSRAGSRARCRRSSPATICASIASGSLQTGYEATGSLGGSFYSDSIEDYYLTPAELGYGHFVKFDHDFTGREALEQISPAKRQKVTLAWHGDDVARAMGTSVPVGQPGEVHRSAALQLLDLAERQDREGREDGRCLDVLRLQLERKLDAVARDRGRRDQSEPGTEVTLVWGEEGGGSAKPVVERHVQTEIRATVSPVPYAEVVRTSYRPR